LPISLNQKEIEYLFRHPDEEVEVNLSKQQVIIDSKIMVFEINESRKIALLEGLDDIGITLRFEHQIAEYESKNNLYTLL
jgi:3-isopropylmalate/(R)-2-methylmalate dehydratase small subunit